MQRGKIRVDDLGHHTRSDAINYLAVGLTTSLLSTEATPSTELAMSWLCSLWMAVSHDGQNHFAGELV